MTPAALTGPFITEAARDGDPTARELLADIGEWLGVGMANLAAAFDPGLFVIGGGVSAADEMLIGPARDAFRRQLTGRGYRPEASIVRAVLGSDAGLIGAAELARMPVADADQSAAVGGAGQALPERVRPSCRRRTGRARCPRAARAARSRRRPS